MQFMCAKSDPCWWQWHQQNCSNCPMAWLALKDIQDFQSLLSQLIVCNWLMELRGDMWPFLMTGRVTMVQPATTWRQPIRDCSYYQNWMINYPDLLHWIMIWWISFILLTCRSFTRICHKIFRHWDVTLGLRLDYLHSTFTEYPFQIVNIHWIKTL